MEKFAREEKERQAMAEAASKPADSTGSITPLPPPAASNAPPPNAPGPGAEPALIPLDEQIGQQIEQSAFLGAQKFAEDMQTICAQLSDISNTLKSLLTQAIISNQSNADHFSDIEAHLDDMPMKSIAVNIEALVNRAERQGSNGKGS